MARLRRATELPSVASAWARKEGETWADFWRKTMPGLSRSVTLPSRTWTRRSRRSNQKYQDQDCKTCRDYRELLARRDIDAVLIATPDHWHVPIALAAVRAGKDLYLEKPMGLSVEEDQLLRKTVQERKRIFQFGTQQRSSREFRQACELVRNGRIGKLKQINVWCSASRPGGSTKEAPVPAGLDYDRWLGPGPVYALYGGQVL